MTSQLPCKQEGWNPLPMMLVWLLLPWSASQSELMYPHKNFKARKDRRYHCTERKLGYAGLCKWLWHPGWIKAPHRCWVQQSKSVWLALWSAKGHLQFRGDRQTPEHPLYSPVRCDQLTPNTFCRSERDGFPCLLPQLVGIHFFSVLETTHWRLRY